VRTIRLIEIGAQEVHRGLEICIRTGMVDFSTISSSVWPETLKNDQFFDFAPEASNFKNSALKMHPTMRWLRCSPQNGRTSDSGRKIDKNLRKFMIFAKIVNCVARSARRRQPFQSKAPREGSGGKGASPVWALLVAHRGGVVCRLRPPSILANHALTYPPVGSQLQDVVAGLPGAR
jgi:hypothetical protein